MEGSASFKVIASPYGENYKLVKEAIDTKATLVLDSNATTMSTKAYFVY